MKPGDQVVIVAGRHRGSKGILTSVEPTPTPSGFNVMIAVVERPRAGATFVFASEIRRLRETAP